MPTANVTDISNKNTSRRPRYADDDRMRGKYLVATWLGLLLTTWTIVIVVVNGLWQLGKWVFGV